MQRKPVRGHSRLPALSLALLLWVPLLLCAAGPHFGLSDSLPSLGDSGEAEEQLPGELAEQADESAVRYVATYAQLKTALQDATTIYIYLMDDITITEGITISPKKTALIIDGLDGETGARHLLTERIASSITGTLYLGENGSLRSITLRNLEIQGVNYYGPVAVSDSLIGIALHFENILYQGPQMIYNRHGECHISDSEIEIGRFGRTTDIGELAECPNAYFSGRVRVTQVEEQTNEIFYISEEPGSIEFLPGSDVTVTTLGDAGFLYTSRRVQMTVWEGGSFVYNGGTRFWENGPLAGLRVLEGGRMVLRATGGALSNGLLRIDGNLEVEQDAVFHLYSAAGTSPLLVINGGSATFRDPLSVLLYSPTVAPIYYGIAGQLSIEAEQVNYWRAAGGGGYDDLPLYGWRNGDGSNLTLSGNVTVGAQGNFSSITTNYDGGTDGTAPPSPQTFQLSTARVVAFGRFPLTAAYLDRDPGIAGYALPQSQLWASYPDESGGEVAAGSGNADDDEGYYHIALAQPLPHQTLVTVRGAGWHLYGETQFTTGSPVLRFASRPEQIVFPATPLSPRVQLVPRTGDEWSVSILDTRGTGSSWQLSVRVGTPLTPQGIPPGHATPQPLEGALIFVDDSGTTTLSRESATPVHTHVTASASELTTVRFGPGAGILAMIPPGAAHAGLSYHASLQWELADVPS